MIELKGKPRLSFSAIFFVCKQGPVRNIAVEEIYLGVINITKPPTHKSEKQTKGLAIIDTFQGDLIVQRDGKFSLSQHRS